MSSFNQTCKKRVITQLTMCNYTHSEQMCVITRLFGVITDTLRSRFYTNCGGVDNASTTNDERRQTNDERRQTNDERRTTTNERRTTNDDKRTTNDEGRPQHNQTAPARIPPSSSSRLGLDSFWLELTETPKVTHSRTTLRLLLPNQTGK